MSGASIAEVARQTSGDETATPHFTAPSFPSFSRAADSADEAHLFTQGARGHRKTPTAATEERRKPQSDSVCSNDVILHVGCKRPASRSRSTTCSLITNTVGSRTDLTPLVDSAPGSYL
jgi:hypothetical protein